MTYALVTGYIVGWIAFVLVARYLAYKDFGWTNKSVSYEIRVGMAFGLIWPLFTPILFLTYLVIIASNWLARMKFLRPPESHY